mgnify:CR=1 FL=1
MPSYVPPLRDLQFVLHELLDLENELKAMPKHAETDADTINAVLEEGGKFAAEVVFPLNVSGDEEGCKLDRDTHEVKAPAGFKEAYEKYVEGGWAALSAQEEYGGQGLPFVVNQCFFEMLNSANQAWTMYPGLSHGAHACLSAHGSKEQKDMYLPKLTSGEWTGTMNLTEPDAGSDVSNLRTRAVYDEATGDWVLNGTKAWITNGGIANVHVVVAAVDPELKGRGQASFVIPPGTKGLSQGQKYLKHGIRASHTAEVVLDNVRVPGRCLLGGKEKLDAKLARYREGTSSGKQPAMATFEATRPAVGAQALGVARAAYEYALDYAKERHAFGKPIIMNQAIAFKLANMITQIDAARLLIWRASWLAKNGGYKNAEGSQSKYYASEMSVRVTEDAIQILGGYGYTREYPVERWHRDAKIHTIFEGTSEIQQLVIARAISGLRIE